MRVQRYYALAPASVQSGVAGCAPLDGERTTRWGARRLVGSARHLSRHQCDGERQWTRTVDTRAIIVSSVPEKRVYVARARTAARA